MSTFNTPWYNNQTPNFFSTLNKSKTPHVVLTAETDDFDETIIEKWSDDGFDVRYVPLLEGGQDFINRVHAVGDGFGLSEQYAIIAFGAAASLALEAHTKPNTPRLVAVVAYYPTTLPAVQTRYPNALQVLVHLAGTEISVWRTSEILGIQGKRRKVRKRIDPGEGHGERLELPGNFTAYTYSSAEPGFAEMDLKEFDGVAEGLAFSRSLRVVREAFRLEGEVERLRDRFTSLTTMTKMGERDVGTVMESVWSGAHVLNAPTLVGGVGEDEVGEFYDGLFVWPEDAEVTLLSRTTGVDRVVDELFVSLTHSVDTPWLLPGVPPTRRKIEIAMVVIFHVRGRKLESEHVYWDQASVLMQAGLLDPTLVPSAAKKQGLRRLPTVAAESARGMQRSSSAQVNALVSD